MQATSCYGSMVASTSEPSSSVQTSRSLTSTTNRQFIEAPAFFYDMDHDLRDLKTALKGADLLNDSGYQSVLERSKHPFSTSFVLNDDNGFDSEDEASDDNWDGYLTVGNDRVKIKDMSDILATRYAFVSGSKTNEGRTIVSFPDSRTALSFEDYSLLITYLIQVPQLEESNKGFVVVVDRRSDKWSAVRTLLLQITSFFPGKICVLLLIKPEGVLQRALEVGYRSAAESCTFKVIQLDSSMELREFLPAEQLTMDIGGLIKYNHLEWVQHRMDIERMKSSATAIAATLSEFGRNLRETELPNDVESTARILEAQTAEKDAIKEDFRISVRKGMTLLRSVRQLDSKPTAEQLSPTRLNNVTAIERMLIQLEETEKSFDIFWAKHETRLSNCLQLRQFEDQFRKLQSAFARHMLYLEEHREVGDGRDKAMILADQHEQYSEQAMEEVHLARQLKCTGEELISNNEADLCGSLMPKCEELERMADALTGALERRTAVLRLSSVMHDQISQANQWCRKGVDILTNVPIDITSAGASNALNKMEEFLDEGSKLQLDSLTQTPNLNNLILLTTTETSTLLAQVAERIDDIRRMSVARRESLAKICEEQKKPIQVVTPEKKKKEMNEAVIDQEDAICVPEQSSSSESEQSSSTPPRGSKTIYIIEEMLDTERTYIREMEEVLHFYLAEFHLPANQAHIPHSVRGRPELVFGNLPELLAFHRDCLFPDMETNKNNLIKLFQVFCMHRKKLLIIYTRYVEATSACTILRMDPAFRTKYFEKCRQAAGHLLDLNSYLVKPVQRITKYQLMLGSLIKEGRESEREALTGLLEKFMSILSRLNSSVKKVHLIGAENVQEFGRLCLECDVDVVPTNRKRKGSRGFKCCKRVILLFTAKIVFAKRREAPAHAAQSDANFLSFKDSLEYSAYTYKLNHAEKTLELINTVSGLGQTVIFPATEDLNRWEKTLAKVFNMGKPDESLIAAMPSIHAVSSSAGTSMPPRPASWTMPEIATHSPPRTSHSVQEGLDTNGNKPKNVTPPPSPTQSATTPTKSEQSTNNPGSGFIVMEDTAFECLSSASSDAQNTGDEGEELVASC